MDLARERRFTDLLAEALDLGPEDRCAHLKAEAADDTGLLAELLEALDQEVELDEFLEHPPDLLTIVDEPAPAPRHLGPYALCELLGSGGMGEVFRAVQEEPVRREVALKLIQTNLSGEARDPRILGPDHPNLGKSLQNLALVVSRLGDWDRALTLTRRALDIEERALGPDLAGVYRDRGDLERAEPLFLRAVAISEAFYYPDHPLTRELREDYAELLRRAGRAGEAAPD